MFMEKSVFPECPRVDHCAQWAEKPISGTFGKKPGKNSDRDVFNGSLEAYYENKHEK